MLNAEVSKILFENEELKAERDALAGQNLELRGALEGSLPALKSFPSLWEHTLERAESALSLPLPDAAERVRVEREKSELLDMVQEKGWFVANEDSQSLGVCQWYVRARVVGGSTAVSRGITLLAALRAARGGK